MVSIQGEVNKLSQNQGKDDVWFNMLKFTSSAPGREKPFLVSKAPKITLRAYLCTSCRLNITLCSESARIGPSRQRLHNLELRILDCVAPVHTSWAHLSMRQWVSWVPKWCLDVRWRRRSPEQQLVGIHIAHGDSSPLLSSHMPLLKVLS